MFALLNYSHTSSFANMPYESKWHAYQPQTNVWENYATGGNQFHPEACEQKGVCSHVCSSACALLAPRRDAVRC
jgi:hypothetical protein